MMHRRFKQSIWVWFLIAFLLAAVALSYTAIQSRADAANTLRVLPASDQPFVAAAPGTVEVEGGLISLSANATGTFTDVLVAEGDRVEAGQLLAVQEDRDQEIAVRSAELALEKALITKEQRELDIANRRRDVARARTQRERGAISAQALETQLDGLRSAELNLRSIEIDIERAQTELETARFRLEQRNIRAPVSGRIIEAAAAPGTGASTEAVSTLFTLLPDRDRQVRLTVDAVTLERIFVGQSVMVSKRHNRDELYPGEVDRIAETFGLDADRIEVVVSVEDLPFRIGQPVLVRFAPAAPEPEGG